jgi:hypothetical protein
MQSIQLINVILPLATIITLSASVLVYRSRKTKETDYEKEMKKLRQLLLKGKLDRKTFLHIRDNLKVEDLFADETQRLDNLLEQKNIDSETYRRMKTILKMSFNERLEKINLKYNYLNSSPESKSHDITLTKI